MLHKKVFHVDKNKTMLHQKNILCAKKLFFLRNGAPYYPALLGWPICACSYGNFSSRLGGISAKSSEIPSSEIPRAGSLLIWTHFYKSFLRKIRSHLGKLARLTGPGQLNINRAATLLKQTSSQVFSYETCKISKTTCFYCDCQWKITKLSRKKFLLP